ncbi:MAG: hypothetical protein EOO06_18395 [Chitinophagaceae bacterium]|nr:MAG: hypothetical protein EOO06_18395 [Chitinophagaceae bacterium]
MGSVDNPGGFVMKEDWEDDGDENFWKPVRVAGRELYNKSIDILNLSSTICDLLDDVEDGALTQQLVMENAIRIPAKIRGGMAVDDIYSLVMENAVIIKVNIGELKAQLWACEQLNGIEKQYVDLLKDEIEIFKSLFVTWVKCFDRTNDLPDDWWLFNNPDDFPEDD